jgi:hypothetical protein
MAGIRGLIRNPERPEARSFSGHDQPPLLLVGGMASVSHGFELCRKAGQNSFVVSITQDNRQIYIIFIRSIRGMNRVGASIPQWSRAGVCDEHVAVAQHRSLAGADEPVSSGFDTVGAGSRIVGDAVACSRAHGRVRAESGWRSTTGNRRASDHGRERRWRQTG